MPHRLNRRAARLVAVLVLVTAAASCAASCPTAPAKSTLTEASIVTYTVLGGVQDVENALFDAQVIAPDLHRRFNQELVVALRAGQAFNASVRAGHPSASALTELSAALDRLLTIIPADSRLRGLTLALQKAIQSARDLARLIGAALIIDPCAASRSLPGRSAQAPQAKCAPAAGGFILQEVS